MIVEYDCEVCGVHVRKKRSPANVLTPPRFCSQRCHGAATKGRGVGRRETVEYDCAVCGVHVSVYRRLSQRVQAKYCSVRCTGLAQRGVGNPAYSGGRVRLANGYIGVLAPDHPDADPRGYVLEHRLSAERMLGRRLCLGEVVHHRNHRKDDNRDENLQVFASHSEHMRHHCGSAT